MAKSNFAVHAAAGFRRDFQTTSLREIHPARKPRPSLHLAEQPRAKVATAQRRMEQRVKALGLSNWMSVQSHERTLTLCADSGALEEEGSTAVMSCAPI